MPSSQAQAGYYVLRSFKVRPMFDNRENTISDHIELSKVIVNWSLSEAMGSPYITGSAVIHESDNLLEEVPLRGEEEIEITYEDFYGESATQKFFLYAIEDISPESSINDRMQKYTIKFTTKQKLFADTKEIRKSFAKQKISQIVEEVYNDYFITGDKSVDKEIEIEETDGEQTLVIPCLKPDAAMHFLSRRAYSGENNTSSFRFFETREKYFFCTFEYLVEKYGDLGEKSGEEINPLFFIYNTLNDNTGPGQRIAQQSINEITFPSKVDTFSDIKQGAYRRSVTELDINTRTRISRDYDYTTEYDGHKMPEEVSLTHSQEFVNTYMPTHEAPEQILITDFPQIGMNEGKDNMLRPYQHFYENYTAKPITQYHLKRNSFNVVIKGRIELYPGMMINLDLIKFSHTPQGTREKDTQRSGKYVVTSITHSFNGDNYTQSIGLSRGGLV